MTEELVTEGSGGCHGRVYSSTGPSVATYIPVEWNSPTGKEFKRIIIH